MREFVENRAPTSREGCARNDEMAPSAAKNEDRRAQSSTGNRSDLFLSAE